MYCVAFRSSETLPKRTCVLPVRCVQPAELLRHDLDHSAARAGLPCVWDTGHGPTAQPKEPSSAVGEPESWWRVARNQLNSILFFGKW